MWPFPVAADCMQLEKLAKRRKVLSEDHPDPGAILLRWSMTAEQYVRASIVLDATGEQTSDYGWVYRCEVIEGRVRRIEVDDEAAFRDSVTGVHRAIRYCVPRLRDRFVAWVDLDKRNSIGKGRKAA